MTGMASLILAGMTVAALLVVVVLAIVVIRQIAWMRKQDTQEKKRQ